MPALKNTHEERFARLVAAGMQQSKAVVQAGYAAAPKERANGTNYNQATRLIKRQRVQDRIEEIVAERLRRFEVTADSLIKEAAKVAFFDPADLFDESGKPKDIADIDSETRAAIAGLEVVEEFEGRGSDRVQTGYVRKWKIADKLAAIQLLMRQKGMLKDKTELSFDVSNLSQKELDTLEPVLERIIGQAAP